MFWVPSDGPLSGWLTCRLPAPAVGLQRDPAVVERHPFGFEQGQLPLVGRAALGKGDFALGDENTVTRSAMGLVAQGWVTAGVREFDTSVVPHVRV